MYKIDRNIPYASNILKLHKNLSRFNNNNKDYEILVRTNLGLCPIYILTKII